MIRHRPFPARFVAAIAGTALIGTLTAPAAYADGCDSRLCGARFYRVRLRIGNRESSTHGDGDSQ
jgi:hypothetical protein